jgi:DNA-directed RNA polymerase specialized sigma subunit
MSDDERTITVTFNPHADSRTSVKTRLIAELDAVYDEVATRPRREREQRNRDIVAAYEAGEGSYNTIGARYGISGDRVQQIVSKARYRRDRGLD